MMSNAEALHIGDGLNWQFVNATWQDGDDNELSVPAEHHRDDGPSIQGHHYAFNRELCYEDCTVRFEVWLQGHTDTGIILRAQDESHFYLLHFPACGQSTRAQNAWAAFSKMDDTGYLKCLKLELLRRVPSNRGRWIPAELTLKGNRISVQIGDCGYFEAQDDTYTEPGHIGLYCQGNAKLRNVVVEGEPAGSPRWHEQVRQPINWFHPCPDTKYGRWQHPWDLIPLGDGELVLNYVVQEIASAGEDPGGAVTPLLARSRDGGRTWSEPEELGVTLGDNRWIPPRLHLTPAGRLICLTQNQGEYFVSESTDDANTWSEPVAAGLGPVPSGLKGLHVGPQAFLNLADGSMVLFCYGGHELEDPELGLGNWGAAHHQAFACRSTDDGRTWSAPVNIDNSDPGEDDGQYANLDLTEVCGVQMSDGRIMALIRPVYSPWMWETWSEDGGATWGPCVRGPFPGYATPNMLRTSSGAVLVAHRQPTLTVNCSLDEGHTWDQGTLIDGGMWGMGSMIEVEPDIVLYVYWDSFESLMRTQLIQVTPSGLEPIRRT